MKHLWVVLCAPVALALGGCNATSAYVKAGEGFTETMDSAKASVKLLADQRTRVARIAYANNVIVSNQAGGGTAEKEFGDFVCKGTGALADARAGVGVLGRYGKSVNDLLKKPDQDVASLWESIATIEERQAKLRMPKKSTEPSDCADEVAGLLSIKMAAVPESGLLAGILTVKVVIDGLNKAVVAVMGMQDEAARARALQIYVAANKQAVADLIDLLDQTSAEYDDLCRNAGKRHVFCKAYIEKPDDAPADYVIPEPNKLAAQLLWQKWASLRQPYLRFQAFSVAAPTARTPEEKARTMDMALRIHRQLGEYDALRTTPSPQMLAKGLREAQQALVDVAEGKTPPGTGWGRIVAWTEAWGDVASGLGDAKKAIEGDE
ncbi:hypothetical protein ABID97_003619 [Variovorax sp. OAS795]|uniref:hypothetical protein n=1 Tax=Variovorax sp. OAS795 TaxID=3034231 RepID=UPI003390F6AA